MTIGILCAMPEENHLLLERLEGDVTTVEKGGRVYHKGMIHGREVVTVCSRWGKSAAAATVTQMIADYKLSEVLFCGVAGGFKGVVHIGDVVVGTAAIHHDMDARPMFRQYEVPGLEMTEFPSERALYQRVTRAVMDFLKDHHLEAEMEKFGITCPMLAVGKIASGDRFISSQEEVTRIRSGLPGVACVEMEGAAVAQVCHEYQVPCVIIRTISDYADEDAGIDFPKFVKGIASHYTRGIVEQLLAPAAVI